MRLTDPQRKLFDTLLEEIIAELPEDLHGLLDEVPLVVDDEPSVELQKEMNAYVPGELSDICGVHSGPSLSAGARNELAQSTPLIQLFRGPLFRLAEHDPEVLREEIRVTLLHELGHHFDFDDDDLEDRGFG